jgi:cytochrome c-type biogenesis protein CcmH/NrfG
MVLIAVFSFREVFSMTINKKIALAVALLLSGVAVHGVMVWADEPQPANEDTSTPEATKESPATEATISPEVEAEHRARIEELSKLLAEKPKDIEALLERGRRCYEIGDIKLADLDFELARELAPDNPYVWHIYGENLLSRGQFKE